MSDITLSCGFGCSSVDGCQGHCEAPARTCGNCRLWAQNLYTDRKPENRGTTCCADAAMDLPISFIPARQTMARDTDAAECCCWQLVGVPS